MRITSLLLTTSFTFSLLLAPLGADSAGFIKLDGVDGESTKGNASSSTPPPPPPRPKGNVEYEWKVEEGESIAPDENGTVGTEDVITDESYADLSEEELMEEKIEVPPGWRDMTRAQRLNILRRGLRRIVRGQIRRQEVQEKWKDDGSLPRVPQPIRARDDDGSGDPDRPLIERLRERAEERLDTIFEEQDIPKPEDWEDKTPKERKDYLRENDVQLPPGMIFRHRLLQLTRNARRADRYRPFDGPLRERKEFDDDDEIENRDAVDFLQRRGILDGNDDGTFNPRGPINRAETLKVLLEALGEKEEEGEGGEENGDFSDVPRDAWFTPYVRRARRLNIVKGYDDGSFRPATTVNQAELLKIAFESFGIDLSDYEVTDLPEGLDPNAWFAPYLQYAIDNDLLDPESIDPATGMTREQFSELIYRLIQQQESLGQ